MQNALKQHLDLHVIFVIGYISLTTVVLLYDVKRLFSLHYEHISTQNWDFLNMSSETGKRKKVNALVAFSPSFFTLLFLTLSLWPRSCYHLLWCFIKNQTASSGPALLIHTQTLTNTGSSCISAVFKFIFRFPYLITIFQYGITKVSMTCNLQSVCINSSRY